MTSSPSIAPSTEIAGVIMPSPNRKRRAEYAEDDQDRSAPPIVGALLVLQQQREHREHAAFAAVVGAQDEDEVLDAHDEDQRPEDERQDAVDVRGVGARP